MKDVGLHTHRFKSNPLEKVFAEEWERENHNDNILKYLLSTGINYPVYVEDRERLLVATIIQWLGSPVGQAFLIKVRTEEEVTINLDKK